MSEWLGDIISCCLSWIDIGKPQFTGKIKLILQLPLTGSLLFSAVVFGWKPTAIIGKNKIIIIWCTMIKSIRLRCPNISNLPWPNVDSMGCNYTLPYDGIVIVNGGQSVFVVLWLTMTVSLFLTVSWLKIRVLLSSRSYLVDPWRSSAYPRESL